MYKAFRVAIGARSVASFVEIFRKLVHKHRHVLDTLALAIFAHKKKSR